MTTALNLAASIEARIAKLASIWVDTPHATAVLTALESLVAAPRGTGGHLRVCCGPGNGKSALIERFVGRYPTAGGSPSVEATPVISFSATQLSTPRDLLGRILERLIAPYSSSSSTASLFARVTSQLRESGVRLVLIDDAHDLAAASSLGGLMNTLDALTEPLGISIAFFGDEESLSRVLAKAPGLSAACAQIELHPWADDAGFRSFLTAYALQLPLDVAPDLASDAMANGILAKTDGCLGQVCRVLYEVTLYALRTGDTSFDEALLATIPSSLSSARHAMCAAL